MFATPESLNPATSAFTAFKVRVSVCTSYGQSLGHPFRHLKKQLDRIIQDKAQMQVGFRQLHSEGVE